MNETETLREQMYGVNAHLHTIHALEGLAPSAAGECVAAAAHTIFQILHHMVYWQDIALARLSGEHPESPPTASLGWTVLMIQGHNSYHLGQIVMLRQVLGTWPPPRGGDTW